MASALRESGILDEQQAVRKGLVICGKEGCQGMAETGVR